MFHVDGVFHAEQLLSGYYRVHTDLTKEQVDGVKGVQRAYQCSGFLSVHIDPRFDQFGVMGRVQELALKQHKETRREKIKRIRESLHNITECKPCHPVFTVNRGLCEPVTYKVYMDGKEVTEDTLVELTEDVAIVPVKELEEMKTEVRKIRGLSWVVSDSSRDQRYSLIRVGELLEKTLGDREL